MKSKAKHFLSHNHTFASAAARVAGSITSVIRQENAVMFHCGRCESSVVGSLLNQHTKVRGGGGIFGNISYNYGKESWVWEKFLDMAYV